MNMGLSCLRSRQDLMESMELMKSMGNLQILGGIKRNKKKKLKWS